MKIFRSNDRLGVISDYLQYRYLQYLKIFSGSRKSLVKPHPRNGLYNFQPATIREIQPAAIKNCRIDEAEFRSLCAGDHESTRIGCNLRKKVNNRKLSAKNVEKPKS